MTQRDFDKAVAKILGEMKTTAEAEVRRRWREEENLIFVREYTVRAHVYKRRPRKAPRARAAELIKELRAASAIPAMRAPLLRAMGRAR